MSQVHGRGTEVRKRIEKGPPNRPQNRPVPAAVPAGTISWTTRGGAGGDGRNGSSNGSSNGSDAPPEQLAAVRRECELHRRYSSADLAFQIDQQRIEAVEGVLDGFLLGRVGVRVG